MPIEFRCSQCDQLLRVPETAAGKHARCPRCQALMAVPGVATAVALPGSETPAISEPGAFPQPPQAQLPGSANPFAGDPVPLGSQPGVGYAPVTPNAYDPAALNPYASPTAVAGNPYSPNSIYPGWRTGLPWENEPRSLGCFFRTMGMVLGSPTQAFSVMRQYGGLGGPLLFNVYAVGMLMALAALIIVPILALVGLFGGWNNNNAQAAAVGAAFIGLFAIIGIIFYGVLLTVVMPLVWAGITHLMLMMVGGAKQGFETTFRVICFGYFSLLLPSTFINIVPYLGGLASMIWIIVVLVHGLARAHETTGGKATAAVLLPMLLCCGLFIALVTIEEWGAFFLN